MLSENEVKELKTLAKENRKNVLKMVHNAKSGHIGGALSSADILTVLYHKCINVPTEWKNSPDFELLGKPVDLEFDEMGNII